MKKWDKPCKTCKGKSKVRCIICGHSDESIDEHLAVGVRERVDFLTRLLARRSMSIGPIDPDIDREVEKHRVWLHDLYLRVRVGKERLDGVAKEHMLTKLGLKAAIDMYSNWMRRHQKVREVHDFLTGVYKDWLNGCMTDREIEAKYKIRLSVVVGARRKNVIYDL